MKFIDSTCRVNVFTLIIDWMEYRVLIGWKIPCLQNSWPFTAHRWNGYRERTRQNPNPVGLKTTESSDITNHINVCSPYLAENYVLKTTSHKFTFGTKQQGLIRAVLTRLFTQQVYHDVTPSRRTPRNNNGILQQIVRQIVQFWNWRHLLRQILHIHVGDNSLIPSRCPFIGLRVVIRVESVRFITKLRTDIIFVYRCSAEQLWYTRLDVQPVSGNQPGFSSFLAFEKKLSLGIPR